MPVSTTTAELIAAPCLPGLPVQLVLTNWLTHFARLKELVATVPSVSDFPEHEAEVYQLCGRLLFSPDMQAAPATSASAFMVNAHYFPEQAEFDTAKERVSSLLQCLIPPLWPSTVEEGEARLKAIWPTQSDMGRYAVECLGFLADAAGARPYPAPACV